MSFDLAIWKRSARTKTAMLLECYEAIIDDKDHTAMDFFDEDVLLNEFEEEFGKRQVGYFGDDVDDCLFYIPRGVEHLAIGFLCS